MQRLFRVLRISVAASLLLATQVSLASSAEADAAVAALQAAYARAAQPGEDAERHRQLIATVLHRVERGYVGDVHLPTVAAAALRVVHEVAPGAGEPRDLFRRAINAGLSTLDSYTRYLDPRGHARLQGSAGGSFVGVGLEVEAGDGAVRVVAPIPGSPAERAGLQRGDLIVRVDDLPLAGVPLQDAIARMRGERGTAVALTIRRPGVGSELTVAVERDTIRRQLVRWTMEGDVLVLRLASFMGAASAGVEQAIAEASATAVPRAVVLDMRGNPGGLLREALRTADVFLGQGEIVSLRSRAGVQRAWHANPAEHLAGLPMVVLVDRRSASASELVAAALQENGRAKVMGQRSYGKGSVQTNIPLGPDNGALRMTTSYYHAPSGRTVQRTGVGPDIELLEASAPGSGANAAGAPPPEATVDAARCAAVLKAADPALACALAYLQAGSVDGFVQAVGAVRR